MSFPRYPEYKDSGVAWLGKVPAHWEVKRIKRLVATLEQGWSPQCEGFPVQSDDEWGVLKVGCVNGGVFRPEENKALPPELEPVPALGLAAGDLLISRANTRELVGGAAIVLQAYPRLMLCDKLYRIRLHPAACEPTYLASYLGTTQVRSQIELAATGASSSMLNIGQSTILELEAPVPPLSEQTAIATFLDHETAKISALVAEQEKLIALLQEKRQAVISHAVTKGLNPNVPMKDSGVEWLGEVPAHWSVQPLKHAVLLRSGGTPDKSRSDYWDGEIPWASAKDLKVDKLLDTADHITTFALEDGAASLVEVGAVLVVVRGMILARTFPVVTAGTPMAINQDLKAVTAKIHLNKAFLPWLLRAAETESLSRLDEAGHGTKALRMDAWGSMPIPVPPVSDQAEIAQFLDDATKQIDALLAQAQSAITLLQERRTALISAAVTGQIDVRGRGQ